MVIPTPNPWVPLRILSLGRDQADLVQADVFLLTDREPATLPLAELPNGDPDQRGLIQEVSEPASTSLLTDLRSDRGMRWLPTDDMWLTKIDINTPAGDLTNDLAVDASGFGQPSAIAAGLDVSHLPSPDGSPDRHVGDARRGGAPGRRRCPQPASIPTERHGLMRRARMRAAGVGALLVSLLLAGAGMATAAGWLDEHTTAPPTRTIHIQIHFSGFDPSNIAIEPGQTVRFVVENTDPIDHEFIVGDEQVQRTHEAGTEAHHASRPGEIRSRRARPWSRR